MGMPCLIIISKPNSFFCSYSLFASH